jgi:anaerobic selenocysteine-containing dehydrogenase
MSVTSGTRARNAERAVSKQPFSPNSVAKTPHIKNATKVESVCPYCVVGCAQLVYLKGGQIDQHRGQSGEPT